ncbi:MAG: bifunctional serine/threonine-protein kinase/formylglycine-generating enzyme family protein [Planctomycetes bacterium]|nr:bifunctional serine/threonine-protein kinase/formylglycine-generating enzyme family protein [Planctomycetota bacterium]
MSASGSFHRRNPALEALRGRFEVESLLGQGAMGAVYRARDRATGRLVALKVVLDPEPDPRRLERFRREGEITASLAHPGIVRVHSAGEAGGHPFLAYELIEGGRTLQDVLPGLDVRGRVALVRDAARALGHAHRAGVLHRDVKPENVLVDQDGHVRVADFGLAAAQGLDRMTRTGASVGTPAYMSPEQLGGRREDVGPQTDVWALGVVLYEALTGKLPFEGQNVLELGAQIMQREVTPPRRLAREVDPDLEAVCLHALQKRPGDRYVDAEELARDLDRALAGLRVTASSASSVLARAATPRARRALGALVVTLLGAATLAVGLRRLAPRVVDGPPADRRPPTLQVDAPADGVEVWGAEVEVTGEATDVSPPIDVSAATTVGRAEARLERGGRFRLRVPLAPGRDDLVVEARDAAGNAARLTRRVARAAVPAWFEALDPARRPPAPLPAGLRFGAGEGEFVHERDGSVLVWVPPGSFVMGADDDDVHERPAHRVRLTRGFFVGKYEVTLAQWRRFCEATGRPTPESADDTHPYAEALWEDARDYCQWAGLRLPTEAEWEYAARGPDGLRFPWGDRVVPGRMNAGEGSPDGPLPVGSFPLGASPFGCLDMAGNVYEWVADWHTEAGYPVRPGEERVDPTGPSTGSRRVLRGGAFNCGTAYCRTFDRFASDGGETRWLKNVGFRVAR